jgi:hypothetical protein
MLTKCRPRPHLISKLYEARPNQCLTCGKRFLATEDGRKEKARHLDWHFHTNQRLVESVQRGLSRSWYVDEMVGLQIQACVDFCTHVDRNGLSLESMVTRLMMKRMVVRMDKARIDLEKMIPNLSLYQCQVTMP